MIKIFSSIIFFYFLALYQTSFLIHYEVNGGFLNLILISIILINFFEKKEEKSGIFIGAIGGFYLDIFSPYIPGFFTLLGIAISFLIKLLKPFFETKKSISFFIIFFTTLLFYEIVLAITTIGHNFFFNIFSFLYNLLMGAVIYFSIKFLYVFFQQKIRK
jgi:rod shape-determining protein MreD